VPNGTTHRVGAAVVIGGISSHIENKNGQNTSKPLVHAGLAAFCGTLPDFLEPALHPNHRQFFHSLTFATALGCGLYKLHKWQPQEKGDKLLKTLGMIAGGAYLVHLAMDSTTPASLPVI